MTDPVWQRQARSFGAVAADYDRYRPSYADAAVRWAVGDAPAVVDLGAGTGILSRQVQRLGPVVTAVEPDEHMRGRLAAASPGVEVLAGSAEAIPLADAVTGAVVVGQAYHWFDPERANPEIARILRPGGVFAVLRNDADPATPWTLRFAEIIDGVRSEADDEEWPPLDFGPWFTPAAAAEFRHELEVSASDLLAVATTRSPYLVADDAERGRLLDELRAMLVEYGLAGRDRIAMPHITRVARAYRVSPQ